MGKYHSKVRHAENRPPEGPHPVWKTLGCLMMVIVPVMAIAAAVLTLQYGLDARWPIPAVMLRPVILPRFLYAAPGLASLLLKLFSIRYLVGYTVFSIVYILLLGGIVSLLYSFLYRAAGPSRYGPLDAPLGKTRGRPYRR
jgi:hypothetical protein